MELHEAIAEIRKDDGEWSVHDIVYGHKAKGEHQSRYSAIASVLNAVADGTLIPADTVFQVDDADELLDGIKTLIDTSQPKAEQVQAGDLNQGAPNHHNHDKRGFDPK